METEFKIRRLQCLKDKYGNYVIVDKELEKAKNFHTFQCSAMPLKPIDQLLKHQHNKILLPDLLK